MIFEPAIRAIGEGRIVGVPTDTVYGIAVDPLNQDAVGSLYELKGRPAGKPIGLLVSSIDQAREMAELDGPALSLASRYWPGGVTLIVTPKVVMADLVGDQQLRTIGIRMPDHPVALGFLESTGPLAVTSANLSGEPDALDHVAARRVFGDDVAIYLPGSCPGGVASTVVDATADSLTILRRGAVDIGPENASP